MTARRAPAPRPHVEPIACRVCRRRATGFGFAPPANKGAPKIDLCGHPECLAVAPKVYDMPDKQLDAYEAKARDEAGEAAGAYLDEVGETDLAALTPEQWAEFGARFVQGFAASLRRQITSGEPPF